MLKKIRNIINNKKYFVIILVSMIVIIIVLCLLSLKAKSTEKTVSGGLEVDYGRDEIINFENISSGFSEQIDITITNKTDELKIYSLSWYNLTNSVKDQQNFLYKISCDGYDCNGFGDSQVPAFDSDIFTDVFLEPNFHHKYTITFTYNGSSNKQTFSGKLVANQNITDRAKVVEKLKQRDGVIQRYNHSGNSSNK